MPRSTGNAGNAGNAEEKKEPPAGGPGNSDRSSIFGAAKPVDTASREKQIEEKLITGKDQGTKKSAVKQ